MTERTIHLSERMDRARASEAALKELDSVFAEVLALFDREIAQALAAGMTKRDTEAVYNLAAARRGVEMGHDLMRAKAADGLAAESEMKKVRQIQQMSPERRKVLGLTIPGVV